MNGSVGVAHVTLVSDIRTSDSQSLVTILIPCFNQADRIEEVLISLMKSMTLQFELIVINDGSTDASLNRITTSIPRLLECEFISRIRVLSSKRELFETKCDLLGIAVSDSPYILEVQADMVLCDLGFDRRMINALVTFDDLFMISGRGTEPISPVAIDYVNSLGSVVAYSPNLLYYIASRVLSRVRQRIQRNLVEYATASGPAMQVDGALEMIFPSADVFELQGSAGRLGKTVDMPIPQSHVPMDRIWLGQSVMRGPLMIDRNRYNSAGGFDGDRFFLGFDDHDLAVRAYSLRGLRCAYLPVIYESPELHGSTRKARSWATELSILSKLWSIRKGRKTSNLWKLGNQEMFNLPSPVIRYLEG